MIRSMTGFGQASAERDGVVYTVEIRSVNNRYFKIQLRLPDIVAFMEADLERLHRQAIARGTISYSLRMINVSGKALFDIDEFTLKAYMARLTQLLPPDNKACRVDLAAMLNLPGIVQPVVPDQDTIEKMRQTVLDLTQQAIDQLQASRLAEGRQLAEDLLAHCGQIEQHVSAIRQQAATVAQEYYEKLRRRVDDLLATARLSIAEEQLARETAIFADRCDISEELCRLDGHVQQFRQSCLQGEAVGRRLDFITQEMLREANTIGSKSANAEIIRRVIDIKCAVDRLKEQVQNVE